MGKWALATDLMTAESLPPASAPEWIKIFPFGEWDNPSFGKWVIDREFGEAIVLNWRGGVYGIDIALDLHHESTAAPGWIVGMECRDDGVWAQVRWTPFGEGLVTSGQYRYVSPEWSWDWVRPSDGKHYANVLMGLALTNDPFFQELPALVALAENPRIVGGMTADGGRHAGETPAVPGTADGNGGGAQVPALQRTADGGRRLTPGPSPLLAQTAGETGGGEHGDGNGGGLQSPPHGTATADNGFGGGHMAQHATGNGNDLGHASGSMGAQGQAPDTRGAGPELGGGGMVPPATPTPTATAQGTATAPGTAAAERQLAEMQATIAAQQQALASQQAAIAAMELRENRMRLVAELRDISHPDSPGSYMAPQLAERVADIMLQFSPERPAVAQGQKAEDVRSPREDVLETILALSRPWPVRGEMGVSGAPVTAEGMGFEQKLAELNRLAQERITASGGKISLADATMAVAMERPDLR